MTPETLEQVQQIILALIALVGAVTALVQRLRRTQAERESDEKGKLHEERLRQALSDPPTTAYEAQVRAKQAADEISQEAKRRATTRLEGRK